MDERYIKVRVYAGSNKERIEEGRSERLEVWVREEPKNNMANRAVQRLVAERCGVEPRLIQIVAGHRSFNKTFIVKGN